MCTWMENVGEKGIILYENLYEHVVKWISWTTEWIYMRVRQIQIKNLNSKDHKQCESQKTLTYPITMYRICVLFYDEKVFKKCLGN